MNAHSNTGTVLDQILESRRAEVDHRKRVLPETALKYGVKAAPPVRDFTAAISRNAINVIAELKPASPSGGIIRDPFDAAALAKSLESGGAAALSVLTEGEFFRGSLKNLRDARKEVALPALRKDFIFDSWQVWESRANDADSFLLIAAALSDPLLRDLIALGRELRSLRVRPLAMPVKASVRATRKKNREKKCFAVRARAHLLEQRARSHVAVSTCHEQ
jgi:indole-3-glycerol phosphate synthase